MAFDTAQITSGCNRTRVEPGLPASTLNQNGQMHVAHTLRAEGHDASEDGTGRGVPLVLVEDACGRVPGEIWRQTCNCGHYFVGPLDEPCPACGYFQGGYTHGDPIAYRTSGNCGVTEQGDVTAALNCATDPTQNIVAYQQHGSDVGPMGTLRRGNGNVQSGVPFFESTRTVRRLTPREAERLQGFPDDFTRYAADGSEISDSARYRMLGNAVAVPVIEWLAGRIARYLEQHE